MSLDSIPCDILKIIISLVDDKDVHTCYLLSKRISSICKDIHLPTGKDLIRAVYNDRINVVKYLIRDKVDPSYNNNEAIVRASSMNRYEILVTLLNDSRVDPSVCRNHALRCAVLNGNYESISFLLIHPKVACKKVCKSILDYACEYGKYDVVKLLLHQNIRLLSFEDLTYAMYIAKKNGWDNIYNLLLHYIYGIV